LVVAGFYFRNILDRGASDEHQATSGMVNPISERMVP
jgi:hypothetical protein